MIDKKKRDFIITTTIAFGTGGAVVATWPLLKSFGPAADVLAAATKEVNIGSIASGQSTKVMWQGKPVYIRNRTQQEIETAKKSDISSLRDPQLDSVRVQHGKENWLVVVGVCTHLGCVPISNPDGTFFCPCHGSYYDTSGRVVAGPAPANLVVPDYYFVNDTTVILGAKQKNA
ncbi:ubiquinol-cytochrome c reductase, iron-sulfur subunit [Neorickettsia helminthoeca str. Oregon]|uniref:Ubiquinol-cytochrome c reductase iron-sulfur subunit n=1 Tax=Neorickettsia helminthoeca str. Oregon TaxID=1286528 RepID=X5HM71_9RICK|nr:ubiquinol-cytochrome c reductase iron-sulfur subunit [Neorickettsia helminthoeca]AHX11535.1 ubiquinol-cytochrome c reductase, iron-sulfur subunit [Neorickettsia helminthoeca str. Oregon]